MAPSSFWLPRFEATPMNNDTYLIDPTIWAKYFWNDRSFVFSELGDIEEEDNPLPDPTISDFPCEWEDNIIVDLIEEWLLRHSGCLDSGLL